MLAAENSDASPWISLSRAYILLNVVRVFSILAMAGTDTLLGFIIVNSFITHTFFLFDMISYINLFALTVFLLMTELPRRIVPISIRFYLATHWPLLSYTSGLTTLGTIQIVIGVIILSFINDEGATSRGALGQTWWRLMCSFGTLLIFIGIVNICVTWVCLNIDDGNKILSARQIRDPKHVTTSTTSSLGSPEGDVEKGSRTSSPIVKKPARVYSQRSDRAQWV